jgi:hypothetical protein
MESKGLFTKKIPMKLGTRERGVDPAYTTSGSQSSQCSHVRSRWHSQLEGRKEGRKQGRLAEKEGKERKGKESWGLQAETELGQHSIDCDADYTQAVN